MKTKSSEKTTTAEFTCNFGGEGAAVPQYPEASSLGWGKRFVGFKSPTSVQIDQTFSLTELEALVSAAQDAGVTTVRIALSTREDMIKDVHPKARPEAQAAA